jgi:hypothetical protein
MATTTTPGRSERGFVPALFILPGGPHGDKLGYRQKCTVKKKAALTAIQTSGVRRRPIDRHGFDEGMIVALSSCCIPTSSTFAAVMAAS